MIKSSKKFGTKMHYVGKAEFYMRANLQVENKKSLGDMKITNSAMNSGKMNSSCKRHYSK